MPLSSHTTPCAFSVVPSSRWSLPRAAAPARRRMVPRAVCPYRRGYRTQAWKRTWRVAAAGTGQNPPAAARMVERVSGWGAAARKEVVGPSSRWPERRRNASNVGGLRDLWRTPAPFTNRLANTVPCVVQQRPLRWGTGRRSAVRGRRRAARPPRRGAPRRRLVERSKRGCSGLLVKSRPFSSSSASIRQRSDDQGRNFGSTVQASKRPSSSVGRAQDS